MAPETWRFIKDGKSASVRPSGPLGVNNGEAMMPALIAGTGVGILPEFIARRTCRRAAGEIAAGLVSSSWRCLLGNAGRRATTEAGRSPRRFSVGETRPALEARNESGAHERAAAARKSQAVMKSRSS